MTLHGVVTTLRRAPGIEIVRVDHRPGQQIAAHVHDWPCLTLYRCGAYVERIDGLDAAIAGPAAVYHPAGRAHANAVGAEGLETLSILFDPAAVRSGLGARCDRSRIWHGGRVGRAVLDIARLLPTESDPAGLVAGFLDQALGGPEGAPDPAWLKRLDALIAAGVTTTTDLAARLRLHPAWLARAYLHATGESIQARIRRRRVERAKVLIRTTDLPMAAIAADAGFCDQSHMVRAFRAVLGRTPSAVSSAVRAAAPPKSPPHE